jgi:hypothetical protein
LTQLSFDAARAPRIARYFAFRGSRRERRQLRAAIAHLIKPYPKRSGSPACAVILASGSELQNSVD